MAKLILIAGISRSGKTTLAKQLAHDLPEAIVLHQDKYVLDESLIPMIRDRTDWESPESVDWTRLHNDYNRLKNEYAFIIIEGIFGLTDPRLLDASNFKILLDLDRGEYIRRRKLERRWGNEPKWFIDHVWESHEVFHNPSNTHLDWELSNPSSADYSEILNQLKS
ncbi:uridine kinase [Roseivirga sp. E12]|uniref:uridine kinase family protein n=1 Tax=Roseivirga sp. E12 TaxID=2819237 RepID=UPI001ABC4531|nr:hypothetical protein [Roseivirga sp. E12]MBO3697988.1 hypothetical protein [Roseivirga sp. E12]